MKKILFLVLILAGTIYSQYSPTSKARGFFLSFGVGPRLPVSNFATTTDLGYGFNIELAYTDNDYLPFFLFGKTGFEVYPGSQNFYQETQYTNLSTQFLPVNIGLRYYFAPIAENVVLFMPFAEFSASYLYIQRLHQFKPGFGLTNYLEENSKLGFSGGAGLSMFLMELLFNYNYFEKHQFISVDLKVRLPLFISI
ncbi:MAG: hypothetical protein HXY49_08475 [Ignavibacteriaceae bacterium]|nr:hypothetical protein [Ignavibacteriaceae bacterium]